MATTQGHYRAQGVEKGPAGPYRRCHRGQRDSGTLNSPAGLPLRTGKTSDWADKMPGLVAKACATLCDPMDCSLPGSSARRISQARMLEWFALSFPTQGFKAASLPIEPPGKPKMSETTGNTQDANRQVHIEKSFSGRHKTQNRLKGSKIQIKTLNVDSLSLSIQKQRIWGLFQLCGHMISSTDMFLEKQ